MKKLLNGLDRWGHYVLAGLCAAAILLSALWTRNQQALEMPDSPALRDQSQRLGDVTPGPDASAPTRPAEGAVLIPYSDAPVYDAATGTWQAHPFVEFSAADGDPVRAMLPGIVLSCGQEVTVDHGDGLVSRYRGVGVPAAHAGQAVLAGDVLGTAAPGRVRVWLTQDGVNTAFGDAWVDNP